MTTLPCQHPAPGGHGIAPRWTRSDKDGVRTAYSGLSRVWFTVSKGILNEVYYPTIDRPAIRDLQYLITDGETFFRDERHLNNTYECLAPDAPGVSWTRCLETQPRSTSMSQAPGDREKLIGSWPPRAAGTTRGRGRCLDESTGPAVSPFDAEDPLPAF